MISPRVVTIVLMLCSSAAFAADDPVATTSPAVPKGEVTKHTFDQSKLFPGTSRNYWVYIPKQYDPSKPACLFVDQDSVQFNSPAVFDQLIASHEMPVTIGVFVAPGVVKAPSDQALDRYNRSYEFDTLSGDYARFLLDELLPHAITDQKLNISTNPDDRCIGGSSSGAICAFTVAWERNDSFHRVFSSIGTFVDLRGGNIYPSLIRKFEPKPIRIFLQDGSNDHNHYGGDWWMANQEMERAFTFAGYEVNHVWGTGGHDSKHATEIFADAMRWVWKDWPKPVSTGLGSEKVQELLIPGEGWQEVGDHLSHLDGPTANADGEVFFSNGEGICKIGRDGAISQFASAPRIAGDAFGPDGTLYSVSGSTSQLLAFDGNAKQSVVADGFHGNDLVVAHNGNIYLTESSPKTGDPNQVWLIKPGGAKQVIDTGLKFPNGICLSPDQSLLYVVDYRSHWVYSYQIQNDGTLADKQKYFDLYVRDVDDDAGGDGMRVDRDGRLYVATRAGIQICDQAGRVNCIIPTPNGRVSNLCFGGEKFDILFATCGDKLYRRKLKVSGVVPFQAPVKPAKPKL
jgi:enterochelin esterase-like enzyme